jgi:hypothetical protein
MHSQPRSSDEPEFPVVVDNQSGEADLDETFLAERSNGR